MLIGLNLPNTSTHPLPIPLQPPVTMATLPFKFGLGEVLLDAIPSDFVALQSSHVSPKMRGPECLA